MSDPLLNSDEMGLLEVLFPSREEVTRSPVQAARALRADFDQLEREVRTRQSSSDASPTAPDSPSPFVHTGSRSKRSELGRPSESSIRDEELRAIVEHANAQIASIRAQLASMDRSSRRPSLATFLIVTLGAALLAAAIIWVTGRTVERVGSVGHNIGLAALGSRDAASRNASSTTSSGALVRLAHTLSLPETQSAADLHM